MVSFGKPSDRMAILFSSDAIIGSLSPNVECLTGYSMPELVGRPISQVLADRSAFELPQMMDCAREWGFWEGEVRHRDRSGQTLDARACIALMSGRGAPDESFLLLSTVGKAALTAAPADYLHEVGSKLRMMAHQLNNPLAVMIGYTQLILMETPAGGKTRSDVERIYAEMKRITQMVEKLHTYALSLQGEPELESSCKTK